MVHQRLSQLRRSVIAAAWVLVCLSQACRLLPQLLLCELSFAAACLRFAQLLLFLAQAAVSCATAVQFWPKYEQANADQPERPEPSATAFASWRCLALTSGRGFLLHEGLQLVLQVSLSYYPLVAVEACSGGVCLMPDVNVLHQQIAATAYVAMLGVPLRNMAFSWLLIPAYCFLDWRYASLNNIRHCSTLLWYLCHRGVSLTLAKLLFSSVPTLIVSQSSKAQQMAVYGVCLPLLGLQCLASGWRVFAGLDSAALWEVWLATAVAFGIGTDVGPVIEELRAQFSKVRMIAEDVLPHHVVESLLNQHSSEGRDAFPETGNSFPMSIPRLGRAGLSSSDAQPSGGVSPPSSGLGGPSCWSLASPKGSSMLSNSSTAHCNSALPTASAPPSMLQPQQASVDIPLAATVDGLSALSAVTRRSNACSAAAVVPAGKKSRSDELPLLPPAVAAHPALPPASSKRRSHPSSEPDQAEYAEEHPDACVLFADVVDFTTISEGSSPVAIVSMLNQLFSKFDDLMVALPNLYKLDTIGDCYMVASGLRWHDTDPCPARSITDFAKVMLEMAATVRDPVTNEPLRMRVGIHKGPVVGALLGRLRRKYSIFGDVVNAASRLESTSVPGAIQISAAVYKELDRQQQRRFVALGQLTPQYPQALTRAQARPEYKRRLSAFDSAQGEQAPVNRHESRHELPTELRYDSNLRVGILRQRESQRDSFDMAEFHSASNALFVTPASPPVSYSGVINDMNRFSASGALECRMPSQCLANSAGGAVEGPSARSYTTSNILERAPLYSFTTSSAMGEPSVPSFTSSSGTCSHCGAGLASPCAPCDCTAGVSDLTAGIASLDRDTACRFLAAHNLVSCEDDRRSDPGPMTSSMRSGDQQAEQSPQPAGQRQGQGHQQGALAAWPTCPARFAATPDRVYGDGANNKASRESGFDQDGREDWQYRGRIELKGRTALETYLMQMVW